MKKLLILLLIASLCLGFVGCSGNYAPVPSTDEELKTVFTLKHNGETYEVKYELYRALFVALKPSVDLGDDSVWSGENKDEYIEKINEIFDTYAKQIVAQIPEKRQSALIISETRNKRAQKNIGYQAYPIARHMQNHLAP